MVVNVKIASYRLGCDTM